RNQTISTSEEKNEKDSKLGVGNNQYHIYDNAFLSACAWDKRLLIPLVNEAFGKNISEDSVIDRGPNEYLSHKKTKSKGDQLVKRITDAMILVDGGKYHFECESKNDGQILLRITEYDMQIALNDADYHNHKVAVELPETAVVFLRKHRNLPDSGTISYKTKDGCLTQSVPYLKMSGYSLEDISSKHLYILMPFYLMRYEHALKNINSKKDDYIVNEAARVYHILTEAYENKLLSRKEYEDILTLCNDVIKEIAKKSSIKERLVKEMGTEVLKTMEERGMEKGLEKGLEALVNSLKKYCSDFYTLYQNIVENEEYANVTEDEVKKYYYT
ncbi:MAG: hypothetical protein IK054_03740, partial [Lachnospiraceae bacterium]|nr:hypothetical protein [Lachnospiraceae bacterium]MBR4808593.1 hypothetical protein [Lachnospiraceae bacterium]